MVSTYVPGKDNQRHTNRLALNISSEPLLLLSGNNLIQNRRADTVQVVAALNGRVDLDTGVCDGPAHLFGQFAGQLILLLFQDIQCPCNNLLALRESGRLGLRSEGLLGSGGNPLQVFGRGAAAGDNRLVGCGGDGSDCFRRHSSVFCSPKLGVNTMMKAGGRGLR